VDPGYQETSGQKTTIFYAIRSYRPGDADLGSVASDFVSIDVMTAQLGFDVQNVSRALPQREAHTRLSDVFDGIQSSVGLQADYRTFYNKSKHGMALLFDSGSGNGPCAISIDGTELSCLKWTDDQASAAARQVCRIADVTADVIVLFMLSQGAGLRAEIGKAVDLAPGVPLVSWLDER
jgi:hypothetical protein